MITKQLVSEEDLNICPQNRIRVRKVGVRCADRKPFFRYVKITKSMLNTLTDNGYFLIINLIWIISHSIRYINTLLNYARNNPQMIMLLKIKAEVEAVKNVHVLIVMEEPKSKLFLSHLF